MPNIYAHRGASALYAEHTRAAYLRAIADGADGLECDLHLTADGQLVLIHDDDVSRTSDGTGEVAELTEAQLRELDFASWKEPVLPSGAGTRAEQLLTFDEFLDLAETAGRPLGLALELKHPNPFGFELEDRLVTALVHRGYAQDELGAVQLSFMSFNPESLEYLAERAPAVPRCQLLTEHESFDVVRSHALALLDEGLAQLAGPSVAYLAAERERLARWRDAGIQARVWDVLSPESVKLCFDERIAEVTTDDPAAVRQLYAQLRRA